MNTKTILAIVTIAFAVNSVIGGSLGTVYAENKPREITICKDKATCFDFTDESSKTTDCGATTTCFDFLQQSDIICASSGGGENNCSNQQTIDFDSPP